MTKRWQDETVLVTGAAGFIGSHLVRRLVHEGASVHAIVRGSGSSATAAKHLAGATLHVADLRSGDDIREIVYRVRPVTVFHLAAARDVRRNPNLSSEMLDVNVRGTTLLLEACMRADRLSLFINTGTCEEYGDIPAPFREDAREAPVSPYSASKVAATHYCTMAARVFGWPVVTVRPFLTYGPRQQSDMFIPSLIEHCLQGRDFAMTDGLQTRDFIYVSDTVDGMLRIAQARPSPGEVINLGSGIEYRIADVARLILGMVGGSGKLLFGNLARRPGETAHFFGDITKLRHLTAWVPHVSLEDGLKRTIAAFSQHSALGIRLGTSRLARGTSA